MSDTFRQDIYELLREIPNRQLEGLRDLWAELGYEDTNDLISTRPWPPSEAAPLETKPSIIATKGDFHIIYCQLKSSQLYLTPQRPIISQLMKDHPFGLFVFSNFEQNDWHLVNVKYDQKTETRRRIFRRLRIGRAERLRTATERITMLDVESMPGDMFGPSPLAIQQRHDEAFDVEAVTKTFFSTYRRIFEQVETAISGLPDENDRRLFTQSLFNRLLFIRFLERKDWLSFDEFQDYLNALWYDYTHNGAGNFYQDRLVPLFFAGLNREPQGVTNDPVIGTAPYLNGGLFEQSHLDKRPVTVPDTALKPVIEELLYTYNFTVTESTPLDIEVAVDPEMLGKIFEELVTGRHESGSYYTPKPIVQFMGQEALKGYLQTTTRESADALAMFVEQRDASKIRRPREMLTALETVKICDPACGSGAYLLGMLHELFDLQQALFATRQVDSKTAYDTKLTIIQHNIYGVDIDPFAVNIARLRLWLSLIVEYEGQTPPALPNLDFKIEAGDSLTAPDPSGGLQSDMFRQHQITAFFHLKGEYLKAHGARKQELRQQIDQARQEIKAWVRGNEKMSTNAFDWLIEFAEVFMPQQAQATMQGQMAGIMNQVPGQLGLMESSRPGGFDIVLANPPYVRQELIKKLKPALKKGYPEVYTGTADLLVYFYARALQLLRPQGMMSFISSNKFMRAGYGKNLRAFLGQQTSLQAVVDFGDLPVFEATAYPMVLVSRKQKPTKEHRFQALTVEDKAGITNLPAVVKQEAWSQVQTSLTKDNWNLVRPDVLDLMGKIRSSGPTLDEYVEGKFYRGIVTGYNKAFVIDQVTRDRLIAEDSRSVEVIKPWVAGRDIKRWRIEWPNNYVIFTRRGTNINDYPAIKGYLEQYQKRLTPGIKGGRKAGSYKWFEIQDNIAYHAEFEKPKIIYPNICKKPEFTFDTRNFYTNQKCFIILVNDKYLLGVLNSKVTFFIFEQTLPILRGRFYEPSRIFMAKFPIATPSPTHRADIESLVQKCLDAKGQGVEQWEAEINRLVYEVYDLTPKEIAIIEGSVK